MGESVHDHTEDNNLNLVPGVLAGSVNAVLAIVFAVGFSLSQSQPISAIKMGRVLNRVTLSASGICVKA